MGMSDSSINQFNLTIRQTPWYQEWFKQRGLDPNRVKLNDKQREELKHVVEANSNFKFPGDMKIDPAGNLNEKGGWAGLPTGVKIAIIAGAAAATGGAMGAFGGAGGVGAGGTGAGLNAASAGAAAQGASSPLLMGSGGFLGLGGGAGTAAAATGAGAATLPTLASHSVGTGMTSAGPTLTGASTGTGQVVGAAKNGGSIISRLMGDPKKMADAGRMFEAFGNQEAAKRMSDFEMSNRYNKDMLQAQRDRADLEKDAMKKLQQAAYLKSGGAPFDASQVKLSGGRELPQFNFPRAPITDETKQGAATLEQQMLERLKPGGTFTPEPLDTYTDRGVGEQIGRWGGVGSSAIGMGKQIWDLFD